MIRPVTCICFLAAAFSGAYLYQTKHRSQLLDREIARTVKQTEVARERIVLLRGEWALLNEPERLAQLAQQHLALRTLAPTQFVGLAEMAGRLPTPLPPGTVVRPIEEVPSELMQPIVAATAAAPARPAPALRTATNAPAAPTPAPSPAPVHVTTSAPPSRVASGVPAAPALAPAPHAASPVQVAALPAPPVQAALPAPPVQVAALPAPPVAPRSPRPAAPVREHASAAQAPASAAAPAPAHTVAPVPLPPPTVVARATPAPLPPMPTRRILAPIVSVAATPMSVPQASPARAVAVVPVAEPEAVHSVLGNAGARRTALPAPVPYGGR